MKTDLQFKKITFRLFYYCIGILFLLISNACFATIVIAPNTVINTNTTYSNDTLDMSNGSFIIKDNATLTIEKCTINGTLSSTNPNLIRMDNGKLVLNENIIHVTASGITPHPYTQSLYYVIRTNEGVVTLTKNLAFVDQDYTVGFLLTNKNILTSGFDISGNTLRKFHGGLFLLNTDHASVTNNNFLRVSFVNIFYMGNSSNILLNDMLLPGNLSAGDSLVVLSSKDVNVRFNRIVSGSCVGIVIVESTNILIDFNKIVDSITYALAIDTELAELAIKPSNNTILSQLVSKYKRKGGTGCSKFITIENNYFALNRFGIHGRMTDHLSVSGNYFVQKFASFKLRKFWTDNSILLKDMTNLTWEGNFYKEAFSQENGGNNTLALKIVTFPQSGGVVL